MNTLRRTFFQSCILLVLIVGQPTLAAKTDTIRSESPPAQTGMPLASQLNPDGNLDLSAGFGGSLDPAGWSLVSGPGGGPRFAPTDRSDMVLAPGDELWDARFNLLGFDGGYVNAIAVSGNDVYVGGQFSQAGTIAVNNIARWNSITGRWYPLGTAGSNGADGPVHAIAIYNNNIYVGGKFGSASGVAANNIARWDSTSQTWTPLGIGMSNTVRAIAVGSGGEVYAGGDFADVETANSQHFARWNGSNWSAVGLGVSGPVHAIAIAGGNVYIGGLFAAAGEVANTQNIARWDGTRWRPLGNGVSNTVHALAVSGGTLYAGGDFGDVGPTNTQFFARWNGSTWSAVGSGVSGPVYAIAVVGSNVYVGGKFPAAGGVTNTLNIAQWNGSNWSALGSGVGGFVNALAQGVDGLYTGGIFTQAGDKASQKIGLWRGSVANPPNPDDIYWDNRFGGPAGDYSPNSRVCAIAVAENGDIYVGGDFTRAGGTAASRIARWDSSSNEWFALGAGITATAGVGCEVRAIVIMGEYVYIAGIFGSVDLVPNTGGVARWNTVTNQWSALGGKVGPGVMALATDGARLYLGGMTSAICLDPPTCTEFMQANNVFSYENGVWQTLGTGLNTVVRALAFSGGNLYAGGDFTKSGDEPMNHVARWDGTKWWPMGSGTNGSVGSITADADAVYVLGNITTAGGDSANHVARWDIQDESWSAMGSGLGVVGTYLLVPDISAIGGAVYAGGGFTTAGGAPANNIARWDGTHWSALGSGISGSSWIEDIVFANDSVLIGGLFNKAGANPSYNFAVWHTSLPRLGSISGRVLGPNDVPVQGARVRACRTGHGTCYLSSPTNAQGFYQINGLPDGQYRVTANPPAGSQLLSATIGPLTISAGASLTGQDIHLIKIIIPPDGTFITPIEGENEGLPSVHWRKVLTLHSAGCPGGAASYEILQDEVVFRNGSMTENPPLSGKYVGTIQPLHPRNGYALIRITILCPSGLPEVIDFPIYIDPSGTVRTVEGDPIQNATVTLYYFDGTVGDFAVVPDQDAVMSPANRTNPDLTDEEGYFGWDVLAGLYKVRAEKAGCMSPNNPQLPYVESEILVVPPPVTDLDLRLDCPGAAGSGHIYLPVINLNR
jgi:hypothetical protein